MSGVRDRDDAMALMRRLESRVAKLERQTPAARTSITRGQFRVASVEGLVVEGSAKVSGLLNGTGTLTWTGPANLNGNTIVGGTLQVTSSLTTGGTTTVNGTLTVNATTNLGGNTTISGTLSITGNVTISGTLNVSGQMTLANNLNVTGGGTVTAGNVSISPSGGGKVVVGTTTINADGSISNAEANGLRVNRIRVTDVFTLTPTAIQAGAAPLWIGAGGILLADPNRNGTY